jgi:hypothetical protein
MMHRVMALLGVVLVGVVLVLPATAGAQSVSVAATPLADTTIRPGHLDFSRYETPSACVAAATVASLVAERTQFDTARYAPDRDSVPSAAIAVARQCGQRFTPAGVPPRELLSLTALSLALGNDAGAQAASDRWISVTSNPDQRAWEMVALTRAFLLAKPSRAVRADRMLARLDSMGTPVAQPRVFAHGSFWQDADSRFDVPRLTRESTSILALDASLSDADRADGDVPGTGGAVLSILYASLFGSTPQAAVEQTMRIAREAGFRFHSDAAQVAAALGATIAVVGHPAAPLPITYWYGPHGANWWTPGRVSLLIEVNGNPDLKLASLVNRLHAAYADSLSIVLIARTVGFVGDSPPLEAAAEADSLRALYQDVLKLPVTVGVAVTPFHRLPDGRRVDDPDTRLYDRVIADATGTIVLNNIGSEAQIDAFITEALHAKR